MIQRIRIPILEKIGALKNGQKSEELKSWKISEVFRSQKGLNSTKKSEI